MNKKQLLLLLGLGVVLAAVAVIVSRKQSAAYQPAARSGAKLLGEFDLNAVAALHLRHGSNSLTLAQKGDVWVVQERGDYPADFNLISDLLRQFWNLKIARSVAAGPSRLPALGLDRSNPSATLLEMKDARGQLLRSVLLGAGSANEGRRGTAGRYVMVGSDPQTVCLVADDLSSVTPTPERWLSKDFFKIEKLKSVAVVTPVATNNWKFTRDTESADWKLADATPAETLDAGKVSGLSNLLSSPSFNDVSPVPTALEQPVVATLETFDGFTYTVKVAAPAEDDCRLQLAVSAQFATARPPGKDEKPEDKDRLDKEFKANRQKLEQKLKTEQSYAKWTYIVAKWTVDQLLKVRHEFCAEKPVASPPPAVPVPDGK